MRLLGSYNKDTHTVSIAFESNCYTDGIPLVDRAIFYNVDFDLESPAFAIASALLFRRYCGELLEIGGSALSIDMVEALRRLLPQVRAIERTDGHRRHNFMPGVELLCSEMTDAPVPSPPVSPSALQLTNVLWSGDFLTSARRSGATRRGRIFTNALLIAESSMAVSVAVGLLSAGTTLERLHVPAAAQDDTTRGMAAALGLVGVHLNFLETAEPEVTGR